MPQVYPQIRDGLTTGGRVVYAVGDIHGRLDALDALMSIIAHDVRRASAAGTPLLVFLGDYVDRGPRSSGVVEAMVTLKASPDYETVCLKGNHEDALLNFLDDASSGPEWVSHGGAATLASYGVAPPRLKSDEEDWRRARNEFEVQIPASHMDFLKRLDVIRTVGDFAFVHAGVRPEIPLSDQDENDLIWIREPFLSSHTRQEKVIVHGHTPTEEPFDGANRIGVDTGAYATGLLTAVRLEGSTRLFLQARVHAT